MLMLSAVAAYAQQQPAATPETDTKVTFPKNIEAGFDGLIAMSYGSKSYGINVVMGRALNTNSAKRLR